MSELLQQVIHDCRRRDYSKRTQQAYSFWVSEYLRFNKDDDPMLISSTNISAFMSYLDEEKGVAIKQQRIARSALLFLYKNVLAQPVDVGVTVKSKRRVKRVPTLLTVAEINQLMSRLDGNHWLVAQLIYGAGLRLSECVQLRVKDVDFSSGVISIVSSSGQLKRQIVIPRRIVSALRIQSQHAKQRFFQQEKQNSAKRIKRVSVIRFNATKLDKFDNSFLFPKFKKSQKGDLDSGSGHIGERSVEDAISQAAVKAAINKIVMPHSLRHSLASHMAEAGRTAERISLKLGVVGEDNRPYYLHELDKDNLGRENSPLNLRVLEWERRAS